MSAKIQTTNKGREVMFSLLESWMWWAPCGLLVDLTYPNGSLSVGKLDNEIDFHLLVCDGCADTGEVTT